MLHTSEKLAVRLLIESIILEPAYFLKVVDAKLFRIVSYTAIATGSANLDLFVRCCIYLTTYDWIKSFLKITMKAEPYMEILRIRLIRFTGQWKIPFIKITIEGRAIYIWKSRE